MTLGSTSTPYNRNDVQQVRRTRRVKEAGAYQSRQQMNNIDVGLIQQIFIFSIPARLLCPSRVAG